MDENTEQLDRLEDKIAKQLDRLTYLVEKKRNPAFIKIEYKRFVDLITQKFVLLQDNLQDKKGSMAAQHYEQEKQKLQSEYKEDIVSVAVAIDNELVTTT
ncbi:MAG: hypothetical protein CMI52_01825 [Parcubacteria group bacterium]|nr:hypothetical protein [Parcubacteria group bacterium]